MAFEGFPDHTISIELPSGLTYSSVFIPKPANSTKSTILFLHGFPSSSYDWHNQITYLSNIGYGIIAPDLLGYGGSSSPTTLEPYIFKSMCSDILSILKHCSINLDSGEKVHIVGHDFGSIIMGALLGYFPHIALTASFLAAPYIPPGNKQDLDMMKVVTEKILGFEFLGYQRFLMSDESWKLIGEHKESFFTLAYGPDEMMATEFLPAGKLEVWLRADRKLPLQSWVTDEYKSTRDRIFAKEDAYRGPTDWYRSRFRDFLGIDDESKELQSEGKIPCPALFIASSGMTGAANPMIEHMKKGMEAVADVFVYKQVSAEGHFFHLEVPQEVNVALEEFLGEHTVV
jgi:soluble epoxide hydrolase/lipid-phosphate phosphatase